MDDFQPRIRDKTCPARVVARVAMRDRTAQFATMCAASTATVARVDGVDVGARVKETRANARANAKVATCETVRVYARTAAIALEADPSRSESTGRNQPVGINLGREGRVARAETNLGCGRNVAGDAKKAPWIHPGLWRQ